MVDISYFEGEDGMKDVYLMLREEILHLDSILNNTINFFYVFIASYSAFSLFQEDTTFLLLSYIVIIPAYQIVLNKMQAMCKIGAYLKIYHEGAILIGRRVICNIRKYMKIVVLG